jgi:Domain of unknown function (DUF4209)
MSLPETHLSKEDFEQSVIEEVISKCSERNCDYYSHEFFKAATEAENSGNLKAQAALELLGHITSPLFMLKPESDDEPFSPRCIMPNGSRSAIPSDFCDEQLDVIKQLAPQILDAELRARMADILWLRKRDFQMAKLAINSYIESTQHLEGATLWVPFLSRIRRAISLAARLGRNQPLFTNIITYTEKTLDKYDAEDSSFLFLELMKILQEQRKGDHQKYATLAEKIAANAEAIGDWCQAREAWQIKAQWHTLQKDTEKSRSALILAAETYIHQAEAAIASSPQSYMAASSSLQKAIEALRRVGGHKERIEELHKTLLDYQEQVKGEMKIFSHEMDISNYVEEARKKVSRKSLHDALCVLALMITSPSVSKLRSDVEEAISKYPLQFLVSQVRFNEKGRVIGHKPSIISNNPEETETAIQIAMFKQALILQSLHAQAIVEPAIYQINLEHNVYVDDFLPIVSNNPLISPGREIIYARGLHAGLKGDFLVAVHLLIPQIEHSIRYLLEQNGFIASSLDDQGIQDEHNINALIRRPELVQILGEDIVFDLKGLLVHRFGSNLRNLMAHGLIDHNAFFSRQVSYLWWLTLRLCCLPIIAQIQNTQEQIDQPVV